MPAAALDTQDTQIDSLPEVDQLNDPIHIDDTLGFRSSSYSNPQISSQKLWMAQFWPHMMMATQIEQVGELWVSARQKLKDTPGEELVGDFKQIVKCAVACEIQTCQAKVARDASSV